MLSDQDPNGGGRTSRDSSISAPSRASGKTAPRASSSDFPAHVGRGISSMLRTETEMGDVGDILLGDMSGFGSTHHRTQRRRASSRMSTSSSMPNTSSGAGKHFRGYPSSSSAPRYPALPSGSQYGTNGNPPAIPNPSILPPPGMLENRNRGRNRSQSMAHTVQPPYNLSNDRSLTSLRHAHGVQSQNPHTLLVSHRAGSRPPYPNHRSISPALSDGIGMRLPASRSLGGQRLPDGGYGHNHANAQRPHNMRGQYNVGQGQLLRGFGNPHNVGQMRLKLPSQSSSRSLDDRREEDDRFPPFDGTTYAERLDRLHSSNLQPYCDRLASKYPDCHIEALPLPANHQQRIAIERSHFERFAPGLVSSGSTYLRTDSDALSSDMTASLTPVDCTSIQVPHGRDDMKELKSNNTVSRNLAVAQETAVRYYDYTEDFYDNPCLESDGRDGRSLPRREARSMSAMVGSPELKSIANPTKNAVAAGDPNMAFKSRTNNTSYFSGSLAAQRITRDSIQEDLELPATDDVERLNKSPDTSWNNEYYQSDGVPVRMHSAPNRETGGFRYTMESKVDRRNTFSRTGYSVDPSSLNVSVENSMATATGGESTGKTTDKAKTNTMIAASLERGKEDRVSEAATGFSGNGPKSLTDDSYGNDTPSQGKVDRSASTRNGMNPSPLVARAVNNNAQTPSNGQSSKSCMVVPDGLPVRALLRSAKDCKEYSESAPSLSSQHGEYLMDPDAVSSSASRDTTSPGCTGPLPSFQFDLADPETTVVSSTRANSGVQSPNLLSIPIPLPACPTQEHFPCFDKDTCAICVRASSQDNPSNTRTNTHLAWRGRVPPVVGVGPRQILPRLGTGVVPHGDSLALTPLADIQEDNTAELEVSRYRYHGPSPCLPDLEESHEGSNSRSVFGTPSSIQASGGNLFNVSRSSTVSRQRSDTDSNVSNALTQSHGLPSMQFSQVDLFGELADDVGLRHSRSMEEVPHVSQRLNGDSPPRPASAGEVQRQRVLLAALEKVERAALPMIQPTGTVSLSDTRRTCSPELQAEIEGLTIPSVGGLTQSFSEFFPSFKEDQDRGEAAESPVEEGAHRVHPAQKRSSARLRPMYGIPHVVVMEDDVYDELSRRRAERERGKEQGGLGRMDGGVAAIDASGADVEEKSEMARGTTSTQTHHKTAPPVNPQTQPRTVPRRRSNAFSHQDPRYSVDSTLSSSFQRSFAAESRLSNSDTNCPPATSKNTTVDTFLPQSAATNHPPHSGPSHPHNRLSEASSTSAFSTAQTATASLLRSPAENIAQTHTRDSNNFGRINDQPHEAGERYPTSALSPPTAIFRDHLCGSDISDGEHYDTTRKIGFSLRKPFSTACKTSLYNSTKIRAGRSKVNIQSLASPESTEPPAIPIVQGSAREARGSTESVEVDSHTSREVTCIVGHLKTWWQKGSDLIRQLTARKDISDDHV